MDIYYIILIDVFIGLIYLFLSFANDVIIDDHEHDMRHIRYVYEYNMYTCMWWNICT